MFNQFQSGLSLRKRWLVPSILGLVFTMAVTGCAGAVPEAEPSSSVRAPTQWEAVLEQIGPDGSVSAQVAKQAFSIAFTPLPGVVLPQGKTGPVFSGTLALKWISQHWKELSAEEQAAVQKIPGLADITASRISAISGNIGRGVFYAKRRPVSFSEATPGPGEVQTQYQAQLGSLFTFYLGKSKISDPGWRPKAYLSTETGVVAYARSEASGCGIFLTNEFMRFQPAEQHFTLAHEVFHCMAYLVAGTATRAAWLDEGLAMWAASNAPLDASGAPGPSFYYGDDSPDFWFSYLNYPERSMYSRSYDAFGFFWYLQNHGVDLWSQWPSAISLDNDTAFTQLTGGNKTLIDWASGNFRESSLGSAWDMNGPGIPPIVGLSAGYPVKIRNGGKVEQNSIAASVSLVLVDPQTDLLTITATGTGHIRLGDGTEVGVPANGLSYCARSDRCACPAGLVHSGPKLANLPEGLVRVAVTGGTSTASLSLKGREFDANKDCSKPPSTAGTWTLSNFSVSSPDFSLRYTPTSGNTTLTINPDDTASIEMNNAGFLVDSSGLFPTGELIGNGRTSALARFDPSTSQLTWQNNANETTGFIFKTNGNTVTSDDLASVTGDADEFPSQMEYTSDGKTMVWKFSVEGGVGMWTWTR